jgi:hypothetical protein
VGVSGGQAGGWAGEHGAHYTGRKLGILDIFFEYSLKIPRIYSNMFEYTRYFLVGRARRSYGRGGRAGGPGRRVHRQPWHH